MAARDRVAEHRRRMKEQGFRQIQVWVPDVRSDSFARAAHEQSLLAAAADRADDTQDWIDDVSAADWDRE